MCVAQQHLPVMPAQHATGLDTLLCERVEHPIVAN